MGSYSIISVIGPDRPGIVDDVSRLIAEAGCNIEDSRMAHLGGDFALMMLVSGEGESAAEVAGEVGKWAEDHAMTATIKPTTAPSGASAPAAHIELDMPDQPGIVSRVTHFLADHGANVEDLRTELRPAPFTGTPTFALHADISAMGKIELEKLRDALRDLADDEDIHITINTPA
jgi:glycine cleavage system transcriptional repressor